MKKLIVVAVAAIACIANMQAQNRKWSLKECIDYAILHNMEVKQSQNRIKSLKVERNTLFFILCQLWKASFYRY